MSVKKTKSGDKNGDVVFGTRSHSARTTIHDTFLSPSAGSTSPASRPIDRRRVGYFSRIGSTWPVYDVDTWHGAWGDTTTPLLMLNGELDGATPAHYASDVVQHYSAPHQHYVEMPWAPHGSSLASPFAKDPTQHCALQLLLDFMAAPDAAPKPRCAPELLLPIDFEGALGLSECVFDEPSP